jgi:transcriptional regulator with PAS, ATPase and Fis domain
VTALAELVGRSPQIVALREQVARVLARQAEATRRAPPILILGETGTGKGLVAEAIHRAGARARGPLVDVNCAAIPETLLEAELFGWERGAFTDAHQAKPGLFQAADGGTIFLDEVGLLPGPLQAKLLKVIDERQVRRLGTTRSEPVDVWVIAATSEDLDAAIQAHRFREDLYHRLAVLTLCLPPLRERGDDVLLLAETFLARACADYGLAPRTLGPDASQALRAHAWPGNVRELANVMERAALLADGPAVDASVLQIAPAAPGPATAGAPGGAVLEDAMREMERAHLREALERTGGNLTRMAARLGIPRNTLRYRLQRVGLAPEPGAGRRRGGRPPGCGSSAVAVSAPPRGGTLAWEPRRLTLLRVAFAAEPGERPGPGTTRALEDVLDKARSFGGWVAAVRPAGSLVMFGIDPNEDAPRHAIYAAVAIRQATARARRMDPARPDVVLAVHTASLLIARVDGEPMLEPDARREACAALDALVARGGAGRIVVSAAAAGVLARHFELEPLEADAERGRAYRLQSYTERAPGGAGFVGRARELRLLVEGFERARAGEGQVVMVVGESGVGKSRLLREFRRRLGGAAAWIEAHAFPFGRARPFHPVIATLRQACQIDDGDAEADVGAKLEQTVQRLGADLAPTLPFLRGLLGLRSGDPAVDALHPKLRAVEIFQATQRLLARAAETQPYVLVLENAQWMDAATEEWAARLADTLATQRVLLVVTYRPGYTPPFADHTFHTRLALTTLSTADSARMARALLRTDRLPEDLESLVVGKAEGNPFFVEELVRSLEELGAVRREGGRLHVARPLDAPLVPDTVQDVVTARIDRLGEAPRRAVRIAAVIGRRFTRRLLERVVEHERPLDDVLGELRSVELIHEQRLFPEVVYAFTHALTHEVAYASIPAPERRALHRQIAQAIEVLYAERPAEVAGALARHFLAAEDWERALRHLVSAAEAAARAFATRDALALYDQALAAAAHLPERARAQVTAIHEARRTLDCVVSDFQRAGADEPGSRPRPPPDRGRAARGPEGGVTPPGGSAARGQRRDRTGGRRGFGKPGPSEARTCSTASGS